MNTIGSLILNFFRKYLANERGVQENTLSSYSDCIRLLLTFTAKRLNVTPDKLEFDSIDEPLVLAFLDHLEVDRDNAAVTRNHRLAVIKTFFRFLAHHEPTMLLACERVCAIASKNVEHKQMETLNDQEIQAIFAEIKANTLHGARDQALVTLMYNTGARAQEVVDLNLDDMRLDGSVPQVKLTGKGQKQRTVPLLPSTVSAIRIYLQYRTEAGLQCPEAFLNDRGKRLTRFGLFHIVKTRVSNAALIEPTLVGRAITPHTFRHTAALHMIRSGVDIVTVKNWLGHSDINTTSKYVDIDMEMKRKALNSFPALANAIECNRSAVAPWQHPDTMDFLKNLSRSKNVMLSKPTANP